MKKVYLDSVIVDENDLVVGQCQMPQAYAEGKILRVAVVMIMNSKGEVLLQKRGPNVLSPNYWGATAGGHVDVGEDYLTAAIRELSEEMGVESTEDKFEEFLYELEEGESHGIQYKRFRRDYFLRHDEDPVIDNDEVTAFRWVELGELQAEIKDKPDTFTYGLVRSAEMLYQYLKR